MRSFFLLGAMRRLRALAPVFAAAATVALASPAIADRDDDRDENRDSGAYSIGVWGDLPYSAEQEATGLPRLLADMNAARLQFSVHDGDLKQGSGSLCDDNLYHRALGWFDTLQAPAMFTPGDNDWADCDRPANGGFNSRERLDRERALFFSTPYSMGQRRLRQDVQAEPLCLGLNGPVACVENRRWSVGRVLYVTLNVTGSCNNLCDTAPDPAEFAARNAANIAWLRSSFALAKARGALAIMLISQANPGWDLADPTRAALRNPQTLAEQGTQPDGYRDFLLALRTAVTDFGRPVAYVHGDSHYFRVDKPLLDAQGRRLQNFTRVETFGNNANNGNNDVQWLRIRVEPWSREVFSYQPMVVPVERGFSRAR